MFLSVERFVSFHLLHRSDIFVGSVFFNDTSDNNVIKKYYIYIDNYFIQCTLVFDVEL